MADGGVLANRAQAEHLLGTQWGMMNETGSYPGQVWLWLYTFWYQIKPFSTSANADILVMAVMGVLSLAFILIPFLPGRPRHPALDPDLQADLARALPDCRLGAVPPPRTARGRLRASFARLTRRPRSEHGQGVRGARRTSRASAGCWR